DGTLVNGFSQFSQDPVSLEVELEFGVVRSTDRGRTWSAPVLVADLTGIGAKDPDAGTPIRTGHEFVQLAADSRGNVYAAWQDARFSGGRRDGIVLSRSADGGRTWSTPVAVNGDPSVQAFSPALAVRHDGTVGVSYYDLRANTPDPATLPTKYWLAGSDDGGVTWSERSVAGPFDFAVAPEVERPAGALYLGDYHGLVASGKDFVPLFPVTTGNALNRTDIFTDGVAIR
ncbi:MAG: sialidase family protein, partial [Kibdelosporangium sp.]